MILFIFMLCYLALWLVSAAFILSLMAALGILEETLLERARMAEFPRAIARWR